MYSCSSYERGLEEIYSSVQHKQPSSKVSMIRAAPTRTGIIYSYVYRIIPIIPYQEAAACCVGTSSSGENQTRNLLSNQLFWIGYPYSPVISIFFFVVDTISIRTRSGSRKKGVTDSSHDDTVRKSIVLAHTRAHQFARSNSGCRRADQRPALFAVSYTPYIM